MGLSNLGSRPSAADKAAFTSSSQYNQLSGLFENRRPNIIAELNNNEMSWKLIKDWLFGGKDRAPESKLPEVKPDMAEFLQISDELKVIWFGHSSFLLNMAGTLILVDPVFSNNASPLSFMVKRFQKPVLALHELPPIDVIVISHDHYDHLDKASIKHFIDKQTRFITPLGVGAHLRGWGIADERILERDWWQSASIDGVTFTATPAQHFSGRDGLHSNETLWASWVMQSQSHNIYFSGDSGYDTHFKTIGEKYGPFDVAFIESGQYNQNWRAVHMLPEESIAAFKDLNAKNYFPVHWGMFDLSMHTWAEPIERISALAASNNINLLAPRLGQVVNVNKPHSLQHWWKQPFTPVSEALNGVKTAAAEIR